MASITRTLTRKVLKEQLSKKGLPRVNRHISRVFKEIRGSEFITRGRHLLEVKMPDENRIYTKSKGELE